MAKFQVYKDGELLMEFEADFREASCPIYLENRPTPFQVADAQHRPVNAAKILNKWTKMVHGESYWKRGTKALKLKRNSVKMVPPF